MELRVGGRVIGAADWRRRDARALLLLLLITPGHRLHRDTVVDFLWPGATSIELARNSLYKALHELRRALEPQLRRARESAYIETAHEAIGLRPHPGLSIDLDRFESSIQRSQTSNDPRLDLRAALDLYRGPLLSEEIALDWVEARRESLRAQRRYAALRLATIELERGNLTATGPLLAVLREDPLQEDVHFALVQSFLSAGQRASASEHVARTRELFRSELGVSLDPAFDRILADAEASPSDFEAPAAPRGRPILQLPALPGATIGRSRETQAVADLVRSGDHRLVNIVGPGGVGKTRLAIETAGAVREAFPDGGAFVDLSAITDIQLVLPAIASALGIAAGATEDLAALLHGELRRGRFLLLLDNLEHLDESAPSVAGLLREVPTLTILATSRMPLRVRAERVFWLSSLPLPDIDLIGDEIDAESAPAAALFVERARAWGAWEAFDAPSALSKVVDLCRKLDGLPLAIELAAARCAELGLDLLVEQLADPVRLLDKGQRDLPNRQQTLEATIRWSYDLLSAEQQALIRGFAAFAGGATIADLAGVLGAAAPALATDLVDAGLVRWSWDSGVRRVMMLETVRAFASRKLERDAAREIRIAHAKWFADRLSRDGATSFGGPQHTERITWMEQEQGNIHRALESALGFDRSDLALRICAGMGPYWYTHGPLGMARSWIDRALTMGEPSASDESGWTALWGAALASQAGDLEAVKGLEERARASWMSIGSLSGITLADHVTAIRLGMQFRDDDALRLHRSNLTVFQQSGNLDWATFSAVGIAVMLARSGRVSEAISELESALDRARDAGEVLLETCVLLQLQELYLDVGNLDAAERATRETERAALLAGDRRGPSWSALVRSRAYLERGDSHRALEEGRLAVTRFQRSGDTAHELDALVACMAAASASNPDGAALHYGRLLVQSLPAFAPVADLARTLPELAALLAAVGYFEDATRVFRGGSEALRRLGLPVGGYRKRRLTLIAKSMNAVDEESGVDPFDAMAIARRLILGTPGERRDA